MQQQPPRPHRTALRGALVGAILGVLLAAGALWQVAGTGAVEAAGTVLYWTGFGVLVGGVFALVAGPGRLRWPRRVAALLLTLVAFVFCGDLFHFLLLRRCYERWNATLTRDADGVRDGCREYTTGSGETALLLLHGFADSPACYQRLAPALAARGFTCRVMRLPGFAMPMDEYRLTNRAAWRAALAKELAELRKGHKKVVVVAHSLGGAITVDYLTDHPEAADGVVLLAPLLGVSDKRSPLVPPQTWFRLLQGGLHFTDRVAMLVPKDVHDKSVLPLLREDQFIPRAIYGEVFALLASNRPKQSAFDRPLLLIVSPTDLVVDSAEAEQFFNDCVTPAAAKTLKRQENAGHVISMDFGWEEVAADVAAFARQR